ncbi:MAG: CRTAC1 family protein [Myxococcales bacterium]|nr:CRTAC1 family protein [Myxococcales bacterium]
MTRRALALCLQASLALACGNPPVDVAPPGDTGDTGDTDDVGTSGDDTEGVAHLPAPQILAAPEVVARGSRLYVVIDRPLFEVEFELAGRPLDGERTPLMADMPGALVPLPGDLPLGETTLVVRRGEDPGAEATWPLTVVEPRFVDVAAATGLDLVHDVTGSPSECAESHTGVAFGDIDDDGDPDAFVGRVGAGGRLLRNLGDVDRDGLPDFEDATEALGLGGVDAVAMATFVDLEGDGDQDLFIGRRGTNRVFRSLLAQTGELRFEDATEAVGLGVESQRTMGVAFGDYDGDDDLDLYVVNHAFCFPQSGFEIRAQDHLYRNDDGVFVERTVDLPDPILDRVGFSAAWVDLERDGDPDLVVINDDVGADIGDPNAVWRNDGPGPDGAWRFTEVGEEVGVGLAGINGMGLALGDVDHDGFVDLAFTNIGENYLLLNAGDGTFVDASEAAGISRTRLPWDRQSITWAPHLFDHDNDGDLDLYFSGGRIKGSALVPDAFFDGRGDGTFEDATWASGLSDPGHGKGSALVDLDRDGVWDLAAAAWGEPLRVHHGRPSPQARAHHWLDVELQGRGGNRDAIGAIVELRTDGGPQTCFHSGRPSLSGGGERTCHFGLGSHDHVTELRVVWPDGSIAELEPPAVDQRVRYVQADG